MASARHGAYRRTIQQLRQVRLKFEREAHEAREKRREEDRIREELRDARAVTIKPNGRG